MDLTTRVSLVQNLLTTKEIPASVGAKQLLDINRISIYYKGIPVSEVELACKEIIDHLHTDNRKCTIASTLTTLSHFRGLL